MSKIILCIAAACVAWGADNVYVIRNATIHPVTAPDIAGGSILIRDGKIAALGGTVSAPRGAQVVDAKGLQVYPA